MEKSIGELGEFGLIGLIASILEQQEGSSSKGIVLGIGDDAAAFRPNPGYEILVTCDSVVEGRHYLPQHITSFELGRRAMALNISDIGAMGGRPLYALVSLGLRTDMLVADLEAMYRGFLKELIPFGAFIIGGNLTRVEGSLFIDITLIGEVQAGKIVGRSGAKPGDAIIVTGYPGEASAGLQLLFKESQSNREILHDPLVRTYILPSHRAVEGQAVAATGLATAMIDISDGLLGDLGHICKESRTGAVVELGKLPVSGDLRMAASRLGLDPLNLVLGPSDDYELIITCPPSAAGEIRSAISQVSDVIVTEIGKIAEPGTGIRLLRPDGELEKASPSGWNHFQGP